MKKLICVLLAVMLLMMLTACGKEKTKTPPDMNDVFHSMKPYLPEDAEPFGAEYVFDAYGVKPEDCEQQVVLSYYDGAETAEIWLIEAVSKDALQTVHQMADARIDAMCDQFQSYDPAALILAEDAELFTEGNCLVLIISDNAQQLLDIYHSAK